MNEGRREVQIDVSLNPQTLQEVRALAKAAEQMGFDAAWVSETQHNPFLPGALITEHTQKLNFGTCVAISFARSPAILANTAWDLAQASGGRFILGLGTQVKAHIERRFGMPWPDSPVGKLREQIGAIRAFWRAWQTGERLNFRGAYYKLSLMNPFFNPGPIEHPEIPIYIAGVNTGLAKMAGECADGFLVHPYHSPAYLRKVLIPAIQEGAAKAGRDPSAVKISTTAFVVPDHEARPFVRQQISFYASTPSYRPVMAVHGWEEVASQLSSLASRKRWGEMPALITDEMLEVFAVIASPDDLGPALLERYQDLADRLTIYMPYRPGKRDDFWAGLVAAIRSKGS